MTSGGIKFGILMTLIPLLNPLPKGGMVLLTVNPFRWEYMHGKYALSLMMVRDGQVPKMYMVLKKQVEH